jgi:hypothetical protein
MLHTNLKLNGFEDAYVRDNADGTYLYIQTAGSNQVNRVDVSNTKDPKVESPVTMPGNAKLDQTHFDNDVAITTTGGTAASQNSPAQTVTLWDLTDPQNPRVALRFDGVRKAIPTWDDKLYVLDSDGLWIVQMYNNVPAMDAPAEN